AGQLYSMNERILLFALIYFIMLVNSEKQITEIEYEKHNVPITYEN
ncbi:MAG: hypothetical protein K0S55_803, partial [Clostridia bacterium]|nr:hypothetical protein [Clostridia bacterium]